MPSAGLALIIGGEVAAIVAPSNEPPDSGSDRFSMPIATNCDSISFARSSAMPSCMPVPGSMFGWPLSVKM